MISEAPWQSGDAPAPALNAGSRTGMHRSERRAAARVRSAPGLGFARRGAAAWVVRPPAARGRMKANGRWTLGFARRPGVVGTGVRHGPGGRLARVALAILAVK